MTVLVGKFEYELPRRRAADACIEAIDRLGWKIEVADPDQIVSYANGGPDHEVRKIEVLLDDLGASTEVRIIGTDSDPEPMHNEALVAELNRVRHAIEASIDEVAEGGATEAQVTTAVPQPVRDAPERPQFAAQREYLRSMVMENGGTLDVRVADLMAHFGLSGFNAGTIDTLRALLQTVSIQSNPELGTAGPDGYVTLTVHGRAAAVRPRSGAVRSETPPTSRAAPLPTRRTEHGDAGDHSETNPLARASLILSLVWLFGFGSLAAILLGGIAQRQIDSSEGQESGRNLATAGIAIGAVGAILAIALAIAIAGP